MSNGKLRVYLAMLLGRYNIVKKCKACIKEFNVSALEEHLTDCLFSPHLRIYFEIPFLGDLVLEGTHQMLFASFSILGDAE